MTKSTVGQPRGKSGKFAKPDPDVAAFIDGLFDPLDELLSKAEQEDGADKVADTAAQASLAMELGRLEQTAWAHLQEVGHQRWLAGQAMSTLAGVAVTTGMRLPDQEPGAQS